MKSYIEELHTKYKNSEQGIFIEVMKRLALAGKNTLNSCIEVLSSSAQKQAKFIDSKPKDELGLLEGIPFGVKDCFMVTGTHTTGGSHILENYVSPYTAHIVQRLLDAGAVLIAKENMDQFGHGGTTENSAFGVVKNAQDHERVAGGSSGGSAANVASGVTVFSIGEDTGGSVRQPAGFNRVFGFKPSYGKISRHGVVSYASSLDTVGIIAKTVKDIAIVFDHIAGRGADGKCGDMTCIDQEHIDIASLGTLSLKGKKIGYFKEFLEYEGLQKEIKDSLSDLFKKIKENGAELIELDFFPGELLVAAYYVLAMGETASELARLDGIKYGKRSKKAMNREEIYSKSRSEGFSLETQRRVIIGNQILSEGFEHKYYHKALIVREQIINYFQKVFEQVDYIVSPVSPTIAPGIDEKKSTLESYMEDLYTVGFSLGKLPTLTIPSQNLSGYQLTGAFNKDIQVLQMGHTIYSILA